MDIRIKKSGVKFIHSKVPSSEYFSRYFAEYQTGLQEFYPKLVAYETKIGEGLTVPEVNHFLFRSLVEPSSGF